MYKDAQGRFRTVSLFAETITASAKAKGYAPVFTLRDECAAGLPSLRKLFVLSNDPTGYQVAITALGSWQHWQKLYSTNWFMEYLEEWKIEQEVRMRSEAIMAIADEAKRGGASGNTAAKFIAKREWEARAGRPSKEEVDRERKIAARIQDELHDDSARILQFNRK